MVSGVIRTEAGYANSKIENPTYREVCTGETHAAETVKVVFEAKKISVNELIKLYMMTIEPTSRNRQGNDIGTQYRTGIYYSDPTLKSEIESALKPYREKYWDRFEVEVKPLENFYPAEDYHQEYLYKNPGGYCHINPQLFKVAKEWGANSKRREELRKRLTPEQYAVTQENATEPPFRNEYWDNHRKGIYVDITTGEPLFLSADKFDSGCGWPSFSKPVDDNAITMRRDMSHGMDRVEVRSSVGNAHLGHVFPDGPRESGGLRYCINSASLKFIPITDLPGTQYEYLLPYLE